MGSFVVLCLFLVVGSQLPTSTATPRCSEVEGSFRVPESGNQCIKIFGTHSGNWDSANKKCQDAGLQLAKPINPIALRKFILEKLGDGRYYWIGARGTSSGVEWLDGSSLSSSNPAWYPGLGRFMTNPDYCLKLLTYEVALQQQPTKPYYIQPCEWTPNLFAMCEVPDCPAPWFLVGDQCFQQSGSGDNFSNWISWSDARNYCKKLAPGGDLAQPKDVKALAVHIGKDGGGPVRFIGGSYNGIAQGWYWINGTIINTNTTDWHDKDYHEMDSRRKELRLRRMNRDGECLVISPRSIPTSSLNTYGCGSPGGSGLQFICERP